MSYEESYKKLIVWKNARELRRLIHEITETFPKTELRRISQMREAARSVNQNIQEGRKRISEAEFLRFLDIARSSLAELDGDIADCREDRLVEENQFQKAHALVRKTDYLFHKLMTSISNTMSKKRSKLREPEELYAYIKPIRPIQPIQHLVGVL